MGAVHLLSRTTKAEGGVKRTALKRGSPPKRGKPPKRSRIRRKRPRDWEDWVAARDAKLAAQPNCEVCGAATREVHHLRTHALGKRNHAQENLQTICREHHSYAEAHPKEWRARYA